MINKLLAKHRQRRATVKYQRGWDWASSCLLAGIPPAVVVSRSPVLSSFDQGIVAAVDAFADLIKEVTA